MNIEKLLLKTSLALMLASSFVLAGPAFPGTRVFTQPDGTTFEGNLKGDSSFNWIESDGAIVKNNPADKFYYKATIGADNSLRLSNQKPAKKVDGISRSGSKALKKHDVSADDRNKLKNLHKKARQGNGPR